MPDRVRAAIPAAQPARAEPYTMVMSRTTWVIAADSTGVPRDQVTRECDGVMPRSAVVDVLKRNDKGELASV